MGVFFGIIGVLFLILLWLTFDYWLGRRNHLNHFILPKTTSRHSDFELFINGEMFFKDYFGELRNAKKHIHILFYIAKNDSFSKEFFLILTQKAKEGLEVRLLLDWAGSLKVDRQMIQELKEAGGQFAFCHKPKLPYLFYSSQTRNHRKISVIDGVNGYIGGFNIGKEYVNKDKKLSPWRDFQLKINGEGVHDLQREFLKDWLQCVKINLLQNKIYFPELPKGAFKHELIPSEGVFLEKKFVSLIDSARQQIIIGSPYFIPSRKTFQSLKAALQRGVTLKILVPKVSDHTLVKEAAFPYFRVLIQEGAQVFQYLNGFYHAKTLIIDEQVCDIGTANFDKRSLFLNHEINCYIYDTEYINKVIKVVEDDIQKSKVLTLEELNQFNPWRSLKERIATIFSQFL